MPKDSEDPNISLLPFSTGRQSGESPAWHILVNIVLEEGG